MKSARHRKITISYLANHISLPSRNTIGYTARLFSNYSIIRAARLRKANPDYCRYYVIKHTVKINIVSNLEYLALRTNARFRFMLFDFHIKFKQIFIWNFHTWKIWEAFCSSNLSRQWKRFERNSIYSYVRKPSRRVLDFHLEFASYMIYITSIYIIRLLSNDKRHRESGYRSRKRSCR